MALQPQNPHLAIIPLRLKITFTLSFGIIILTMALHCKQNAATLPLRADRLCSLQKSLGIRRPSLRGNI